MAHVGQEHAFGFVGLHEVVVCLLQIADGCVDASLQGGQIAHILAAHGHLKLAFGHLADRTVSL